MQPPVSTDIKRSLPLALALCFPIAFAALLFNLPAAGRVLWRMLSALLPVVYGLGIAFVLLPLAKRLEAVAARALPKASQGSRRGIALLLTYLLAALAVAALIRLFVPQLVDSIVSIAKQTPEFAKTVTGWAETIMGRLALGQPQFFDQQELSAWAAGILTRIADWLMQQLPAVVEKTFGAASGVFNLIICLVLSVYMLAGRDRLRAQVKKLLTAMLPRPAVQWLMTLGEDANSAFGGFLLGQGTDSLIVGLLCFVSLKVLGVPYAPLIAVVVGVTNMIPTLGPFIGGVPSVLLVLMVSLRQALVLTVFLVVLQQIDGNLLSPRILGDRLGISGFWVTFAVVVFGKLLGFLGLFLGVPLFALLYRQLARASRTLLERKRLPTDTPRYQMPGLPEQQTIPSEQ